MNYIKTLTTFVVITVLFSACGVITKTRYGNGLKLNLSEIWQKKDDGIQNKATKQNKKPLLKFNPVAETHQKIAIDPINTMPENAFSNRPKEFFANTQFNPSKSSQNILFAHPAKLTPVPKVYGPTETYRPMEPNVRIATILFFASLLLANVPYLSLLAGIFLIIAFILCWIGLSNIRESGGGYSGKGIAITIIVLYILALFYALLMWMFFLAFFI